LEEFEPDLYTTLRNILKSTDVDKMDLTFSTSFDNFGYEETVEFKAGGSYLAVTEENKQEFVDLYVDWYLNKSIVSQFRPFYNGFYKVISIESIKVVDDKAASERY
jgi:hypothetical protein